MLTIVRPAKGLLGGMRALPSSDWDGAGRPEPPVAGAWRDLGAVAHGFTHFELVLSVRAFDIGSPPPLAGEWLFVDDIDGAGLPTLFQKAATLARAHRPEAA